MTVTGMGRGSCRHHDGAVNLPQRVTRRILMLGSVREARPFHWTFCTAYILVCVRVCHVGGSVHKIVCVGVCARYSVRV